MSLKFLKFERKPFYADGVQITEDNMEEIVAVCGGKIVEATDEVDRHIEMKVTRPYNKRQTMGFPGDWVLKYKGYKIYQASALQKSFIQVRVMTKEQADAAGVHPPIETR